MTFHQLMMRLARLFLVLCVAATVPVAIGNPAASAEESNTTTTTIVESATTSTTPVNDGDPCDGCDPAQPISDFKSADVTTQNPTGSWTSTKLCGPDSTPNPWCYSVEDSFKLNITEAGKLTVNITAAHWNSGPDNNEAFNVSSSMWNGKLSSTGTRTATVDNEFTGPTSIIFDFDHTNWNGGSVQSTVTWSFTPAPKPEPTDVDFTASIVCSALNGTATYTLNVTQTTPGTVNFTPANGTVMQNGNNLDVTASWLDPNFGTLTKTVNAAGTADCTPPVITPPAPPAPPTTNVTCPSGLVVRTIAECDTTPIVPTKG